MHSQILRQLERQEGLHAVTRGFDMVDIGDAGLGRFHQFHLYHQDGHILPLAWKTCSHLSFTKHIDFGALSSMAFCAS